MNKSIIVIFLFLTTYCLTAREPHTSFYDAIKSTIPKDLAYKLYTNNLCLSSETELESIIESSFKLNDIKFDHVTDLDVLIENQIYLYVSVDCISIGEEGALFDVVSFFGRAKPRPSVLIDVKFGGIGFGSKEKMNDGLKRLINHMLKEYIFANNKKNRTCK